MKIISFGYTTAPLLAKRKCVTRRDWKDQYALSFRPNEIVQAYDKQARFGGKKIGEIKIVSVLNEHPNKMPDSDYEDEGFAWLDENPDFIHRTFIHTNGTKNMRKYFRMWRMFGKPCWVIRFEPLTLLPFESMFAAPL
ncbi:hypothetical protein ACO1KB_19060 [Leptospira interrogans serovar Szwajizak]|uniref:hypothetical protein n=1 Tax=Leptospira interrogans TaxID=173 RepID=UPI000345B3E9|nr:hypothetical protein [Leptospira interrogans]